MSVFFGGEFFAGGFFANLPVDAPTGGGGSSAARTEHAQYTRGTGKLKFELPKLAKRPKRKAKRLEPEQVDEAAADSLVAIARSLEIQELPPYALALVDEYRQIIENRRLRDAERERRMIASFLEMQEEEETIELLLMGM